jgi:hypothetical protein
MLASFVAGGLVVGAFVLVAQSLRDANSLVASAGAAQAQPKPPAPAEPWLKGSADERFVQAERHLRGLDVAMFEIGYRYDELLSAGKTRNWDYAQYQTEKIDLSLRLAIERRPKRAKSAKPFLDQCVAEVLQAIKTKDGPTLDAALDKLRIGCIECHRAENVLYMGQLFATIQPTAPATARTIQQ